MGGKGLNTFIALPRLCNHTWFVKIDASIRDARSVESHHQNTLVFDQRRHDLNIIVTLLLKLISTYRTLKGIYCQ